MSGSAVGRTAMIMVTHNSAADVGPALAALTGVPSHVIDNASVDGTPAYVRAQFPAVRLTARTDNPGFAVAVNEGLRSVGDAEYVLLLNPDCVLAARDLAGLEAYLDRHPSVGLVGPRLLDADGAPVVSGRRFESLGTVVASRFGAAVVPMRWRRRLGGATRRRAYAAAHDATSEPLAVDWLSGACLLVRRSLLERVGGLDEAYFLYYEDEELAWQLRGLGAEVVLVPSCTARHRGGASSSVGVTWPHLYRSMIIFFGRHRTRSVAALRLVIAARSLCGLGLAALRRLRRRPEGRPRWVSWWAVLQVALGFRPGPETVGPADQRDEVLLCGS